MKNWKVTFELDMDTSHVVDMTVKASMPMNAVKRAKEKLLKENKTFFIKCIDCVEIKDV